MLALLGIYLPWARRGSPIASTHLFDDLREHERKVRDAAIEGGWADAIPDQNQRAYEARRATLVTVAWFAGTVFRAIGWMRTRLAERRVTCPHLLYQ